MKDVSDDGGEEGVNCEGVLELRVATVEREGMMICGG